MLRNYVFVICIIFFSLLIINCASNSDRIKNAPDWISYESINQVFPEKDFIARIGSGASPLSAQLKADSELSSFFNQNIKSFTEADDSYVNINNSTTSQKNLNRTVTISTDTEIIGLKHTDTFFNKTENCYYICAYINKKEFWDLIEPKLKSYAEKFELAKLNIKTESDNLRKILIQNNTLKDTNDFYHLYYLALSIIPKNANVYSNIDYEIQKLINDNYQLRNQIKIKLTTSGDSSNRIKTKIEELLAKEGITISQSNNTHLATININTSTEITNEFFFVYPQIQILVSKKDRTTLSHFSKQFGKISSYSKETAERLALNKIETELDNNFINNLLYNKWSE